MEKLLVVQLGVEGGGATIYGSRKDGIWSFWRQSSSIALDEYDDESWRSWESEPVQDLSLALPNHWPMSSPINIAPEFLDWFRENYEIACSRLPKYLIVDQREHPHREWMWLLYGKDHADLGLAEKNPDQTSWLDASCCTARSPNEERQFSHRDREESDTTTVTLFSWGYYGWGNHTDNLVKAVDAVEISRGFQPPFFVDTRIRRSVRAAGFKGMAFERLLGETRHRWMPSLGNRAIVTGTGPDIQIADPSAAQKLLDLALELSRQKQRLIFFCSCEWPREEGGFACHRTEVASLVLKAATNRAIHLKVVEWPGGEPKEIDLHVPRKDFTAIKRGRRTVPLGEKFDLAECAGLPWCSLAILHSGDETLRRMIGPAISQTTGWALPVLDDATGSTSGLREYKEEVTRLRSQWGLEAALS
jgi:hypothetical protein